MNMPPPVRLLFLVADTGGGHRASGNAVARQLAAAYPGRFDVHLVDPFVEVSAALVGRTVGLYSPIARHGRWLWGAMYHATNSRTAIRVLRASSLRAVEPGVAALVRTLDPRVVVSFHPLLNHLTARVLAGIPGAPPLVTVVTDLVDVHAGWLCSQAARVVVGSPAALDRCRRAGLAPEQCEDLGLPVDPAFAAVSAEDREQTRRRLGVEGSEPLVLIMGGGDGAGGMEARVRALAARTDVRLAVVCGRNERLRSSLEGLRDRQGRPVDVAGFVEDMPLRLAAADLLVTKAGPGTIAEALCCGTPLVLTWYLPGQERGNVDFVLQNGVGRYAPRIHELVDTVTELAAPGSPALGAMRAAVLRTARPQAAANIAELIAGLAPVPA
jgi:1,2-diacylglycerol 3-beta-galactosyltransferase